MRVILELVFGIVIAIGFYNFIHHFLVIVPNRKKQELVKRRVDRIVNKIVEGMVHNNQLPRQSQQLIKSSPLSVIWGRGIFVYEYKIDVDYRINQKFELIKFKKRLSLKLAEYCKHYHQQINGKDIYVVADVWCYQHCPHVDIACRINSATDDYLKDLQKL